jgi:hypothetical protein
MGARLFFHFGQSMELLGLLAVMNGAVARYSWHAVPQTGCPKRKVRASPEINLLWITLWGSQSLILYCNAIFGRRDADATRMSGPQGVRSFLGLAALTKS